MGSSPISARISGKITSAAGQGGQPAAIVPPEHIQVARAAAEVSVGRGGKVAEGLVHALLFQEMASSPGCVLSPE